MQIVTNNKYETVNYTDFNFVAMDLSGAMIEDVDDLDLIPDEELEETYLERIASLKGCQE